MKTVKMTGEHRFYFPSHEQSPFNGMFAHGASSFVGHCIADRLPIRQYVLGYNKGDVKITAKDFGSDMVLVKEWYSPKYQKPTEKFYII